MTREQVMSALSNVQEPDLGKDLVTLNMVKDVEISGDDVSLTYTSFATDHSNDIFYSRQYRSCIISFGSGIGGKIYVYVGRFVYQQLNSVHRAGMDHVL